MKLEIINSFFTTESCDIYKRICDLTDIEEAAKIATRVCHNFDTYSTLSIYRGDNHIALVERNSFGSRPQQVAIFTSFSDRAESFFVPGATE